MNAAGIVAEYNPFHTGHAYHIERTRRLRPEDAAVVAVMSGGWVQRGECAVADKWTRARAALEGGVDLVLELPCVWAVSSAESFARGAISLLNASGVVDALSFGSESGDLEGLRAVARCLDSPAYQEELKLLLDSGAPFAVCRQSAAEKLAGKENAGLLERPNDGLGVEYIRALNALDSRIRPVAVKRKGPSHDSDTPEKGFLSASRIRAMARNGDWDEVRRWTTPGTAQALQTAGAADMRRVERAMLARLRTMDEAGFAALPDSGAAEGLPFRLVRAARQAASLEMFYDLAKTRRYAHARIRRLAVWAFLGITARDIPQTPPYLRVLGFNRRGQALLREMKTKASLPVLTKPAHARELGGEAARLFELEARCTDLFDLCLEQVPKPGRDWTTSPVKFDPCSE